MSATHERFPRRPLLLAGVSALALALGACSAGLQEKAESEAKSDSAGAAALVRIGDASRAGGDLQSAVGFYERASLVAPNDAATQMRLATALLEMGAYGEAEAAFKRVLATDPNNIDAMRGLGNIYIATDQAQHAVEQFQGVIAKKPSYQAYNGLGVALDLEGQHPAAQKAYHEGLAQNATSLTLQNNLALSLALSGDYPAAIQLLQRVAQNPQATLRHRQNLALVYGLAGDNAHAAAVAKQDLDAKAVEANLAYYAWLRAQPKLSPSDVMRYSGPKGQPKTPAIEEGRLPDKPAKKSELDIDATASTEPVEGVRPVNGIGAGRIAIATAAATTVAAAPRTPVVEEPTNEVADAPDIVDPAVTKTSADGADKSYVLLPEERAARAGKPEVIDVAHTMARPAARPTTHFRDMSFAQFARSVGIYGPACEDDYHRGKTDSAGTSPAETPVVDKGKPVVASLGTTTTQTAEAVEQVAYRIDSTITLEGLRRY
jgi:Flp pilus assembly protein TadD